LDKAAATNERVYVVRACTLLIKAANLKELARNDAPSEYLNAVNTDLTNARILTNDICKIANGSTPFPRTDARTDAAINAQKRDLQKGVTWALGMYQMATSQWEEGNQAAACSTVGAAADELARITSAMRANPELEGAFGNPAQIYHNAKIVVETRDETFCNKVTGAQRNSLEQDALQGETKGKEAKRLYEAGDFPGSCAAARLAVDAYARMTSALRSDPTLRSAFNDPDAVFENAKVIADYRDRFYCAEPG
ncbi:MAG: hypothetical protein ABL914_13550, partial [Novosphingobium sp.]|uniref:hypothetical protein n=1 Tax=Novosphingobium sp. TaxID=1874826 RepID=UPI0032B9B691